MDFAIYNDLAELRETGDRINIFNSFEGEWKLERDIFGIGSTVAIASFKRTRPTTLHYSEQGTLTLKSGFVGQTSKQYIYELRENDIRIIFADTSAIGNTFLTLDPIKNGSGAWAQDTHFCGADRYQCTYDFVSKDTFLVDIEVRGANKTYSTRTKYVRS